MTYGYWTDTPSSGVILRPAHRRAATRRVVSILRKLAGKLPLNSPETWKKVAANLNIALYTYCEFSRVSRGQLVYASAHDQWIIELNTAYSDRQQVEALVHELAHYFLRESDSMALCDEPIVFCYETPVATEHHRIARCIEAEIMARADRESDPFLRVRTYTYKRFLRLPPHYYRLMLQHDLFTCHVCKEKVRPPDLQFDSVGLTDGENGRRWNVEVSHKLCNPRTNKKRK